MKRFLLITLLLISIVPCLNAQKKELAQARTLIKSGKELDKAINLMDKLLRDSLNRRNMQVWQVRAEAIRAQYEQGNERLYLKQKQDTAELFLLARKMFLAYQQADSIDALPDRKGRVAPKYRRRNAEYLHPYRKNLFYGGNYFLKQERPQEAYNMVQTYIESYSHPLFEEYAKEPDRNIPTAAYVAVVAGHQLDNPQMSLKYAKEALQDTIRLENTLVYLSETYFQINDTTHLVECLWRGFENLPTSEYFFTRLYDYYNGKHEVDTAMMVVEKALAKDMKFMPALNAKSDLLLNLGDNNKCVDVCNDIIALEPKAANAYYNAGAAYVNMAIKLNEGHVDAARRKQIRECYSKAMPYIEKYKELEPQLKSKWGPVLYDIYLKLNLGKKFEQMERLLRSN